MTYDLTKDGRQIEGLGRMKDNPTRKDLFDVCELRSRREYIKSIIFLGEIIRGVLCMPTLGTYIPGGLESPL
jgi:hypothetical protein